MPLLRNKIIEVADVSLRYDRLPVLTDIDLTVFKDDFLVITGPNGGGKTSLLRIILGLQLPSRGAVHFYREGQLAHNLNIGYLPQKNVIDSRFPITVSEVVFSGLSGSKKIFSRFTKKEQEQVEENAFADGTCRVEGSSYRAIVRRTIAAYTFRARFGF